MNFPGLFGQTAAMRRRATAIAMATWHAYDHVTHTHARFDHGGKESQPIHERLPPQLLRSTMRHGMPVRVLSAFNTSANMRCPGGGAVARLSDAAVLTIVT